MDTEQLQVRLGHRFQDKALLERALTHRSVQSNEEHARPHNERLEHLGDAILGFLAADHLFRRLPDASEGDLSRIRSRLVETRALAVIAVSIGIPTVLRTAPSARRRTGIARGLLADCVEALLGAVYLDGGFLAAQDCFIKLFQATLDRAIQNPGMWSQPDPKTALQELMQKNGDALPEYRILSSEMFSSLAIKVFHVECVARGEAFLGYGPTRRDAEQDSALRALYALHHAFAVESVDDSIQEAGE